MNIKDLMEDKRDSFKDKLSSLRDYIYRLDSNTEVSENLGNYKKTKTIPKSYLRNPRGSKKAAVATGKQPGKGQWNPK